MEKEEKTEMVRCKDCARSYLFQWDKEPMLSNCPVIGSYHAETPHKCKEFEKATEEKEVLRLTRFR